MQHAFDDNDAIDAWPAGWHPYRPTDLMDLHLLAEQCNVSRVLVKCENQRPLGNFKVLGGMRAALRALSRSTGLSVERLRSTDAARPELVCASDGNHGLAVAAAAHYAKTRATIYLPAHVTHERERRLQALNAQVIRIPGTYDNAVDAAMESGRSNGSLLIADTTATLDDPIVRDVMSGYGLIAHELRVQLEAQAISPTHIFIQAGVGGLAAAMAQGLEMYLHSGARLFTVEPAQAACVAVALMRGRIERINGPLDTCADMLSCGEASAPAIEILRRHNAIPLTLCEGALLRAPEILRAGGGPLTTSSGAAGLAGLTSLSAIPEMRQHYALTLMSCVLLIVTEGV